MESPVICQTKEITIENHEINSIIKDDLSPSTFKRGKTLTHKSFKNSP